MQQNSQNLRHPLQDNYRLLRVYAWYRALLASVLLGMFALGVAPNVLGKLSPLLYGYTVGVYTLIGILSLTQILLVRKEPATSHIFITCLIDILAISLIMYCSGGIATGLGSLIFITVAAGSIFLRGQMATLLAAIACILVLLESFLSAYISNIDINPLAVALLGMLLFVTSLLFQYLTRKILASQATAAEQASQAAILLKLNEMIVQRMYTGIVVLDKTNNILLYNKAAASLLNLPVHFDIRDHLNFANYGFLFKSLRSWIENPHMRPLPVRLEEGGPEVQLNFAKLDNPGNDLVLVFAEDTRYMSQRAQQLKLASLGHLTASIAHEVRNPLGAISHAAQLLSESEVLTEADRRLAAIIQNHTMRVNSIIENVLQLSRRQAANPERQDLCVWLRRFAQQHAQSYKDPVNVELDIPDFPVMVYVDFSQMEQVLNNLCSNGLRYSEQETGRLDILLKVYLHSSLANPCLDVIDYGCGISEEDKQHIFEPFFTTDKKGTGLGLYIARELCLANQASLDYKMTNEGLSCFQISFSHSNKMMG